METKINSKLIKQKNRSIINDKNYITLDIECYLEKKYEIIESDYKNNKNNYNDNYQFIPYSCQ
jgi:hypothetical protein